MITGGPVVYFASNAVRAAEGEPPRQRRKLPPGLAANSIRGPRRRGTFLLPVLCRLPIAISLQFRRRFPR